ncbi:hypothetical protein JW949_03820 [Candidatus Woesearchaeota archaeon]|nr:hypothetical protein [Candidatus Woesearchaeota archaeon]
MIIGFNFTKISAEKKGNPKGNIKVKNNITITDVDESKSNIGKGKKAVNFKFKFSSEFNPDIGSIEIEGNVADLTDEKDSAKLVKEWKKNKNVTKEFAARILSKALRECSVEAITLSKEMNLPSPVPLPKIENKGAKK